MPPTPSSHADLAPILRRRLVVIAALVALATAFFATFRAVQPNEWAYFRSSPWGTALLVCEALVRPRRGRPGVDALAQTAVVDPRAASRRRVRARLRFRDLRRMDAVLRLRGTAICARRRRRRPGHSPGRRFHGGAVERRHHRAVDAHSRDVQAQQHAGGLAGGHRDGAHGVDGVHRSGLRAGGRPGGGPDGLLDDAGGHDRDVRRLQARRVAPAGRRGTTARPVSAGAEDRRRRHGRGAPGRAPAAEAARAPSS